VNVEDKAIANARRHLAIGVAIIARQERLIAELRARGHAIAEAEQALE
jgi:hypothetical protein